MPTASRSVAFGWDGINDNAHIERFNRTTQDECLGRLPDEATIRARLTAYLDY